MKHDYRFEIQEDKLGICFSVITTDEVDAVTRANEALRQIHDMPEHGFDIPLDFAGIVRARLYLADMKTKPSKSPRKTLLILPTWRTSDRANAPQHIRL